MFPSRPACLCLVTTVLSHKETQPLYQDRPSYCWQYKHGTIADLEDMLSEYRSLYGSSVAVGLLSVVT